MDPDVAWLLEDGRYRGFRLSAGQYDPSITPRLARPDDTAAVANSERWLAHLQGRDTGEETAQQSGPTPPTAGAIRESSHPENAQAPAAGLPADQPENAILTHKRKAADDGVRGGSPSKKQKAVVISATPYGYHAPSEHPGPRRQPDTTTENRQAGGAATSQASASSTLPSSVPGPVPNTFGYSAGPSKRKVDVDDKLESSSSPKKTKTAVISSVAHGGNTQTQDPQLAQYPTSSISAAERVKTRKRGQAKEPANAQPQKKVRFTEEEQTQTQTASTPADPTAPSNATVNNPAALTRSPSAAPTTRPVPRESHGGRRGQIQDGLPHIPRGSEWDDRMAAGDALTSAARAEASARSVNQAHRAHARQRHEERSSHRPTSPHRDERVSNPQTSNHGRPSQASCLARHVQTTPQQRSVEDWMAEMNANVAQAFAPQSTLGTANEMPPPASRPRAPSTVSSVRRPLMAISSEATHAMVHARQSSQPPAGPTMVPPPASRPRAPPTGGSVRRPSMAASSHVGANPPSVVGHNALGPGLLDDPDLQQALNQEFIEEAPAHVPDSNSRSSQQQDLLSTDVVFTGQQPLAPHRPANGHRARQIGAAGPVVEFFTDQHGHVHANTRSVATGEQQTWHLCMPQRYNSGGRVTELVEGDEAEDPIELD